MSADMSADFGIVTAYGYALSKGYQGTEEEFAEDQARLAEAADDIENLKSASLVLKDPSLPNNTDLNSVVKTGVYKCLSARTYLNTPYWFVGGYLIVLKYNSGVISQIVTPLASPYTSRRMFLNNTWSDWSFRDGENYVYSEMQASGWERGTYNPLDGSPTSATNNIRSRQAIGYINGVNGIKCDDGYIFTVFAYYPDGTYVGKYNTSNGFDKSGYNYAFLKFFDCTQWKDYVFRISLRKDPIEYTDLSESTHLQLVVRDGNQWLGKTAFFYGTSLTYNVESYRRGAANLLNKGISGEGIGNFGAGSTGAVYSAICNLSDGKENADLIVIETTANDVAAGVPLGTIYDTDHTASLAGCLNSCIRYLQAHTNAQIVVTQSTPSSIEPNATDQVWEWKRMIRDICFINSAHFIDSACNLGFGKVTGGSGSDYLENDVTPKIHPTRLGAYNAACNFANQLKLVPLFVSPQREAE